MLNTPSVPKKQVILELSQGQLFLSLTKIIGETTYIYAMKKVPLDL